MKDRDRPPPHHAPPSGFARSALLLLLLTGALTVCGLAAQEANARHKPFVRPLPIPKVLTSKFVAASQGCRRFSIAPELANCFAVQHEAARKACAAKPQPGRRGCEADYNSGADSTLYCVDGYRVSKRRCLVQKGAARRIRIPIREAGVRILPGSRTRMNTFDGSFPGPTIRVPSGSPLKVEFVNQLKGLAASTFGSEHFNVLSIHNHGGHNPAVDDGQPNEQLIPPGASREYTYPLREGGKPERAAFQWYHDHRMDGTADHIWRGLAGMFILDDQRDQALPLPKGRFDVPLLIADRSFTPQNQLTDPYPLAGPAGRRPPPDDGVQGDHILVNGVPQPVFKVEARRYRLRLLNASNFRSYDFSTAPLSKSPSLTMKQIATDSGLMSAPVKRRAVRLGPAERAEVIVDFSGKQGRKFDLKASFLDDRMTPGSHGAASPRLMCFNVVKRTSPDRSSVPAKLRPAPPLSPPPTITRQWRMTSGIMDASHRFSGWAINGKPFDPDRIDARVPLGKTERWRFTNATGRPHAMHVHGADFKLLDGPNKGQLKDTVLLPTPGASATVAIKFTDHAGKFVLHCHMLDLEDNGMMAAFEVVNGPGDKGAAP